MATSLPGGGRVGILADTHCEAAGRRLPPAVFDALAGAQLIVHLGDCGDPGALDELARVAPVVATRGGDDAAQDPRYAEARVIEASALVVGALFDLARTRMTVVEGRLSVPVRARAGLTATFGRSVDVVLFGATHAPLVAHHDGILFVNPGSATLPAHPGHATIAVLDVAGAVAHVEIVAV